MPGDGKTRGPHQQGEGNTKKVENTGTAEHKTILKMTKDLSEAMVFAEPSDPGGLAQVHNLLQALEAWAKKESYGIVAEAIGAMLKLIERVILEESKSPMSDLDIVSKSVSAIQSFVADGRPQEQIELPPELGVSQPRVVTGSGLVLPPNVDEEILSDFLMRQGGILDDMEALLLELEKAEDENKVRSLQRLLHTMKGEAALLGLADVEKLCHAVEDVLNEVKVGAVIDMMLDVRDWLAQAFDSYSGKGKKLSKVKNLLERISLLRVNRGLPAGEAGPAPGIADMDRVTADKAGEEFGTAGEEDIAVDARSSDAESAHVVEKEERDQTAPLAGDRDLLGDFVTEAREHLEAADVHLLTLETEPKEAEALNAVFRAFHTIKGVAGFLALDEIGELAHEAENLLDKARRGERILVGGAIDVTFDSVDALKRMVEKLNQALAAGAGEMEREKNLPFLLNRLRRISSGLDLGSDDEGEVGDIIPDDRLGEILVESGVATRESVESALRQQARAPQHKMLGQIMVDHAMASSRKVEAALQDQQSRPDRPKLGEIMLEKSMVSSEDLSEALRMQESPAEKPRLGEILVREGKSQAKEVARALRNQKAVVTQQVVQVKETVKVDADRLDRLLDTIGELVIAEAMVSQADEVRGKATTDLERQLQQLDKITRELQEMGTSLRMIPLRTTFQKMARLVRDLSRKSGKPVNFRMAGEDTELDKSVVDQIGDPLVHMVRNAIDHGIEPPVERREAGKTEAGTIELRAFHKGGSIYIEIKDDGKGLDRQAILAKARERGLVQDGDALSDREVFNLIFEPGFSTAKKVTDVSGRGVGMDVVRKNVETLRGQIDIRSEPGQGSVFTMRLPLTLAIIDGMVVKVGEERYIIPTLSVVTSIRPRRGDMTTVLEKGEMLKVQGRLLPLFRLGKLFEISGARTEPEKALVVVVESDERQTGLLVDELLGQQQIVIKSLGDFLRNSPGLSGAAIMPDGSVGLILDVSSLVRLAHMGENYQAGIFDETSEAGFSSAAISADGA